MKRIILSLLCLTCLSNTAYALKSPVGSKFDYRIKHIDYNPQDVVKMDAVIGIATHIIVKTGEEYVTHAFGDPNGWSFAHKNNHYFVKAKAQNSDTNLVIVTDKHSYNFVLHFIDGNSLQKGENNQPQEVKTPWSLRSSTLQVQFSYPVEEAQAAAESRARAEANKRFDTLGRNNNLNYSMSAAKRDRLICPINVWDDGRFTYFKFAPNVDLPNIYTITADGSEAIVNRHMLNHPGSHVIVAEKVAPKFLLRLGDAVVGVYNESFDSFGIPNESGTAIPDVRRVIKQEGK